MSNKTPLAPGTRWAARHDRRIIVVIEQHPVEYRLSGRVKVTGVLYQRTDKEEPPTVRRTTEFVAMFQPIA